MFLLVLVEGKKGGIGLGLVGRWSLVVSELVRAFGI